MTTTVTITCDGCGASHSAAHHAGLMNALKHQGWVKGPRIENVTTHFCRKKECRETLARLIRRVHDNAKG